MTQIIIAQGREVSEADIELIRALMTARPAWGRTPLSGELCRLGDWRGARGQHKNMAARVLAQAGADGRHQAAAVRTNPRALA